MNDVEPVFCGVLNVSAQQFREALEHKQPVALPLASLGGLAVVPRAVLRDEVAELIADKAGGAFLSALLEFSDGEKDAHEFCCVELSAAVQLAMAKESMVVDMLVGRLVAQGMCQSVHGWFTMLMWSSGEAMFGKDRFATLAEAMSGSSGIDRVAVDALGIDRDELATWTQYVESRSYASMQLEAAISPGD